MDLYTQVRKNPCCYIGVEYGSSPPIDDALFQSESVGGGGLWEVSGPQEGINPFLSGFWLSWDGVSSGKNLTLLSLIVLAFLSPFSACMEQQEALTKRH